MLTAATRLHLGQPAPNASVLSERGEPVRVQDLWQAQPVAIFFWRHLG